LVKRFGFAAAAVLGLIDFLDRAKPRPGMPLASRARIIAELEGVVGKNAVDQALKTLIDAGVIKKIKSVTPGQKNLSVSVEYSLCPAALADSRDSRFREFWELPDPGPESGTESGVPYTYGTKEKEAEAAVHAAAAPQQSSANPATGKRRRVRRSGIVTWTEDDAVEAERIEMTVSSSDLACAVESVRQSGREPVPGLVARELDRIRRARKAEVAAQARRSAASTPPPDPEAKRRGEMFLETIRRRRQAAEAS